MNADGIDYTVGTTGFAYSMSGSEIPLPEVAAALGEISFGVKMPLIPGQEPGDFRLDIVLRDLSVSDMIWGMLDPSAALPHDPATLIVDLAGTGNWLIDIMDPEAMAELMGPPGEVHSLDINELLLSIAGAELTGSGAFTFDNNDWATFGMPAPTGALNLKLVGGNTLLDTLVGMGLVPEQEAMGARMMLGLFARPGEGEDTLLSDIEVDGATGALSANGQRLQ